MKDTFNNELEGINMTLLHISNTMKEEATIDQLKKRIVALTRWLTAGEVEGEISNGNYERSWINQG